MAKKSKQPAVAVVERWRKYFGRGDLADWQQLLRDLRIKGEFQSKTKCRQALRGVWVNIHDFLDAVEAGRRVRRFPNEQALARYTVESQRIFPKRKIEKGSPLSALLAHIL